MIKRDLVFKLYFKNLDIYTKEDRKVLQEIFARRIKNKVEFSEKYIKALTYTKHVRVLDTTHQFYEEYKNLKIGQVNWFDDLSKNFKSYLGWFLQNKYTFESKPIKDIPTYIIAELEERCKQEILNRFYDEYLDDDGEVKSEFLQDFYFNRKIELSYYDKLFKLYRYILEDNKLDLLNEDGSIKADIVLDYCVYDEKIPSSTQEKIRVSVGRTKESFDSLAKANCQFFKYFVTLTFASSEEKEKHLELNSKRDENEYDLRFNYLSDISSLDICNSKLDEFFYILKRALKKDNIEFYYLGCPEYQANGHVHYHFLFSDIPDKYIYKVPKWLDFDYYSKRRNYASGLVHWKYGKSDIQLIQDPYKVTTYIAKYIQKSLDEIDGTIYFDRLNKKRYYASRNLLKPKVEFKEIDNYDFEFNSVYVRERKSKFNENEITEILYSV